jgi:hypothetical protein
MIYAVTQQISGEEKLAISASEILLKTCSEILWVYKAFEHCTTILCTKIRYHATTEKAVRTD